MEQVSIRLSAEDYDEVLLGKRGPTLPQCNDAEVIVKPNGTQSGAAVVMITFLVRQEDGIVARAQMTTTAAMLESVGKAITGYRQGGHIE